MGVPASGLAHRTMKHTIEVLACWNCTLHVFYTIVPEKSGHSHERVSRWLYDMHFWVFDDGWFRQVTYIKRPGFTAYVHNAQA